MIGPTSSRYTLESFIRDMRQIMDTEQDRRAIVSEIDSLIERLMEPARFPAVEESCKWMDDLPNAEYIRQIMNTQRNRVAVIGKVEPLLRIARKQRHLGTLHFCPVCESPLREFVPTGNPLKPNRRCPVCGSLERHRLVWLFFHEKTNLFAAPRKRLLHVAPELCLASMLQDEPNIDYVSADITRCAMIQTDFTRLCFRDETFDAVYASHVLEHIVDDRMAIREVYRTLKPGGWAILQVPVKKGKATYEDASIVDPNQREQAFGQRDHVRIYGEDYYDRLRESGFTVHREKLLMQTIPSSAEKLGLASSEEVYFCTKTRS